MLLLPALLGIAFAVPTTVVHLPHPKPATSAAAADSSAVLFSRARELARAGHPSEALAAYHAAAVRADSPDDWARFRRDIAWIATPKELTVWDATATTDRPAQLLAFWNERDVRDGLATGGRLAEHVRRLDVALAEYRIRPKRGRSPIIRTASTVPSDMYEREVGIGSPLRDYLPGQGELDDRGVIFVRQGEPVARRYTSDSRVEGWVYAREGKTVAVFFTEALFDGSSGNTMLVASPPSSAFFVVCDFDRTFCGNSGAIEQREKLRQRTIGAIRALTTTDTAKPTEP
ncbi:MAG: hypothetical protein IPO52_14945 [Gemmatimonadetes bacterium]|nr:hypothetical protein [Gemmatimonadota bacterium]